MNSKLLTVVRRLLLALCVIGVVGGVTLVVMALLPEPAPEAQAEPAEQMRVVEAGTASIRDEVLSVGAFEIDPLEVSVREYAACVRAGVCPLTVTVADVGGDPARDREATVQCSGGRRERAEAPMNCVDWAAADAYCKWVGKRLPTREEWWHAIAATYPEGVKDHHREVDLGPDERERGEWTATMGSAKQRGPWPVVRYAVARGAWRGSSRLHKPYTRMLGTSHRAAWLSFRCAR